MAPFELAQPADLAEAISLLDADDARPLSGGTALMLMMKAGVLRPRRLVSLRKLNLEKIEANRGLRIGAMTTLGTLERSSIVKKAWPVIARALRTVSNVRVRNVATIGGALAHADPHMDLPPLLAALGAHAVLQGKKETRTVPVEELYAGYLENTLKKNEIITRVDIPPLGLRRAAYLKCTTRSADDWPALGIAVVTDFQHDIRIFVSAATDRPTRLTAAETVLKESAFDVKRAAEAALSQVRIESDMHGSADYKKQLLRVYLGRAIHEARSAGH